MGKYTRLLLATLGSSIICRCMEYPSIALNTISIGVEPSDCCWLDFAKHFGGYRCRLALFDKRDPRGEVQELLSPSLVKYVGGHDYKTNTRFSCMATSGDASCLHSLLGFS